MKLLSLTLLAFCFSLTCTAQFASGDTLFQMITTADHEMIDVDNDGDLDVVVVGYYEIVWYENEGDEEFSEANMILEDITGHFGIFPADINDDGFMDFTAYYQDGTNRISWFQNMGDGTFTPNVIVENSATAYYFLDDDSDGDFDLIYANIADGVYRVAGNPGGTFDAGTVIDDAVYNYYNCYHTDFDNDGDQDLIFGTNDGAVRLKYAGNLGGGTYASPAVVFDALDDTPKIAAFADMDNDGDEDWILGIGFSEYFSLKYYENTGGDLETPYDIMESSGGRISIGDLDNDGFDDIVGLYSKSQHMWIKNNGDGTFEEMEALPMDIWADTGWLTELSSVHLYDLDGDGDLEVYGETTQDYFYFTRYKNLVISDYNATGHFFADLNNNGIWDADEDGVDFPDIGSDPAPEATYVYPSGEYFVGFPVLDDVSYTITPVLPENWEISTPDADYTVLIDGVTVWEDLNFGVHPTETIDSISAELIGGFPRCNDTITCWISLDNYGTTRPGGIISLRLDDSITYVSSAFEPDSVVDQTVYWSYDSLGWYDNFQISLRVAMPDFLSEGDEVTSYLTASVIDEGIENYVSEDSLVQIIRCAYDPNDKTGFPFGVDEEGFISIDETTIEYTIRFQNTGTDTAFTVRIEDQLDAAFNWESFQVLAKSHDMEWSIDGDGNVGFLFENIMLPDSNVNEEASQGYIKYQIEMDEGLSVGTVLQNTAYIFFDLNPAIETNTTKHTLMDCETILSNVDLPTMVCGGEHIVGETEGDAIPSSNVFTWEIGDVTTEGNDFSYLESEAGMHEIVVTATTDFCEASESFSVNVLEEISPAILPSESICVGDSLEIFGLFRSEAGVYTDSLTTEGTGCDSLVVKELMLYDVTVTTINTPDDDLLCEDEASVALSGEPSGGVFEGTGVVGSSFDPAVSGIGDFVISYSFEDDNGCITTDNTTVSVVDCLGLNDQQAEGMNIYPNPFSDFTLVQFTRDFKPGEVIVIVDLQGRQVRNYAGLKGNQLKVAKADLAPGLYVLQLLDENGKEQIAARLVVE